MNGQSFDSTAQKAQNRVADIAKEILNFNELGIYCYDVYSDSNKMLYSRLDGIIASVCFRDIVIFQFPTWNDIRFDEEFIARLNNYYGLKKVFFIHDMPPLMFESNRYLLGRYIALCNQADLVILPSQRMTELLQKEGLKVEKILIQKIWDFPVDIDQMITPRFEKKINFAGNPELEKFSFVKQWNYDSVELDVTANEGDWAQGKNIKFLGWFTNESLLANAIRKNGGFGLVWSEDSYWREYMKLNANYKFSTYLASGIPVIVNNNMTEKDTVIRKNLGIVVESLDEAVERVAHMDEEEYKKMVENVNVFSNLVRQGYFTKKVLTDAVFHLLYD